MFGAALARKLHVRKQSPAQMRIGMNVLTQMRIGINVPNKEAAFLINTAVTQLPQKNFSPLYAAALQAGLKSQPIVQNWIYQGN